MHVLKSNLRFFIAVSLTFAAACARDRHDPATKPASPPAPAQTAPSSVTTADEQPPSRRLPPPPTRS